MTDEQYMNAEIDVVERLQMMREAGMGSRALVPTSPIGEKNNDIHDDVYEQPVSSEQTAAYNEGMQYCRIVKRSKMYPKKYRRGKGTWRLER